MSAFMIDNLVNEVCKRLKEKLNLKRFPDLDNYPMKRGYVGVLFHKTDLGRSMFHFVTTDNIEIKVTLRMQDVVSAGYLDAWVAAVIEKVDKYREYRRTGKGSLDDDTPRIIH